MRILIGGLTAAALVATVGVAGAGAQTLNPPARPVTYGIDGGITFPVGNLSDGSGIGFNLNGLVGWHSPTTPLGLRGEVGWTMLSRKTVNIGTVSAQGPRANIVNAIGNVTWTFRQSDLTEQGMTPYVLAGVGVYYLKYSSSDVPGANGSNTNMGINGGGGINFPLGTMSAFAEARIHHIFGNGGATMIPLSFGLRF